MGCCGSANPRRINANKPIVVQNETKNIITKLPGLFKRDNKDDNRKPGKRTVI